MSNKRKKYSITPINCRALWREIGINPPYYRAEWSKALPHLELGELMAAKLVLQKYVGQLDAEINARVPSHNPGNDRAS